MENRKKWHQLDIVDVFDELKTSESGLSEFEVKKRIGRFGLNKLPEKKVDSYFTIFLRQFKSPLIYVLLAASVVVVFVGEYVDAVVIMVVVIANSLVGAYQEGKAQNTLSALNKFTKTEATVFRDDKEIIVEDELLVPGDVISLGAGDKVPADARIISASGAMLNEASLTGESSSVKKNLEVVKSSKDVQITEMSNMIFRGTFVTNGNIKAVVVSTGLDTVVGGISSKLSQIDTEIPLQKNIRNFSKLIIIATVVINLILVIAGLFYGNDLLDIFLVAVAISVSFIPEGLPIVITLVLASGVWRMSQRNALVKRLQAVESLGQASVIALDKTGTLTKNELMVSEVYFAGETFQVSGDGYESFGKITQNGIIVDPHNHQALTLAGRVTSFCSNAKAFLHESDGVFKLTGEPTEVALDVFAQKVGFLKENLEKENPKISEIPFNSDIKYHSTVHKILKSDGQESFFLTIVGAPEVIIERADFLYEKNEKRKISQDDKEGFLDVAETMSARGLRVIALGFNDKSEESHTDDNMPKITLLGLLGMFDVIRPEAKEAVMRAYEAKIKLVMITGDNPITAWAIAREVGINVNERSVMSGYQLRQMSDEDLESVLDDITVFARVTPEDKLRIIRSYKKRGEVVAMTGDGVNDALSLVAADLGVSMGKIGTEVAKEASDIVLLDDNFGSIISAVEEGRRIYDTIHKVVLYLFSTNIGEVLVVMAAALFGWPLPLLASQIIWLNMITGGFLVIALAYEPKEKNILKRPQKKPSKYLVDRLMMFRTVIMGSVMMIGTLLLFRIYLPESPNGIYDSGNMLKVWTITLTVLAVFQWFNIWNSRSEKRSVFQMGVWENKSLLLAVLAVVLLQLFAVYNPLMQKFLHTTALGAGEWLVIFLVSTSIIWIEEIRKYLFKKYNFNI